MGPSFLLATSTTNASLNGEVKALKRNKTTKQTPTFRRIPFKPSPLCIIDALTYKISVPRKGMRKSKQRNA